LLQKVSQKVARLVKKNTPFTEHESAFRAHKRTVLETILRPPPVPFLIQMKLVHILPARSFEINFNNIFSSTSRSYRFSLPFCFFSSALYVLFLVAQVGNGLKATWCLMCAACSEIPFLSYCLRHSSISVNTNV
jgi:hypothetical protein